VRCGTAAVPPLKPHFVHCNHGHHNSRLPVKQDANCLVFANSSGHQPPSKACGCCINFCEAEAAAILRNQAWGIGAAGHAGSKAGRDQWSLRVERFGCCRVHLCSGRKQEEGQVDVSAVLG
jgi:hypothetical protein